MHAPSGCINTVPINLTRMLSDNLNICAINKYTNMFGDDTHIVQQQWGKLIRPLAIPAQLKSIPTFTHLTTIKILSDT